MKTVSKIASVLFLTVLVMAGCSQGEIVKVLDNGTIVSAEEMARLKVLEPEAMAIINSDLSHSEVDLRVNALLEAEFGPEYTKFIMDKSSSVGIEGRAAEFPIIIANEPFHFESDSSVSPAVRGTIHVDITEYRSIWDSYTFAEIDVRKRGSLTHLPARGMLIQITDDATPSTNIQEVANEISLSGNRKTSEAAGSNWRR